MSNAQSYISFGSGLRLMSEDVYIKAMGGNMSRKGFRALCRNLLCPMIEIGDTRYVEMIRFELAMTAITRIGEEDFFAPGSRSIRNQSAKGTRKLDPEKVLKNYEVLAAELLAAKKVNGVELTHEEKDAARTAANRMRESALHMMPSSAQARKDRKRAL